MNRKEVFNGVQDIFRDIFDEDDMVIEDKTNSDDIEEWDSLNHINLVSAIDTDRNFGGGMFRHNINHGKSPTLLALDIIKKYHKKYVF